MTAARSLSPRGLGALFAMALTVSSLIGCGQETETASPETLEITVQRGTDGGDVLDGTEGGDVLQAGDGDDELYGGEGRDELYGGPGDDVIDAQDPGSVGAAGRDRISCGPGRDEVLMDANDEEEPRGCEMAGVGAS